MKIAIGFAIAFSCFFFACSLKPVVRSNEGSLESKSELTEKSIPSEQWVDFEGVSFRYDPRVFGDVTKAVVPEFKLEDPGDKPDSVEPENIRFDFEFGRKDTGANTRITVYPVDEFDDVYAVSPHMVKYISDRITSLRKILKDRAFRMDGDIPNPEWADASEDFYVKVNYFNFPSGNGIMFVTHLNQDVSLVSNRNLIYRFEGITADEKYFVIADMPVSVSFLPDNSPEEFDGFTEKDMMETFEHSKAADAKYKKYIESISTRLEKLKSNEYSPNLEKFEAIISSLTIAN